MSLTLQELKKTVSGWIVDQKKTQAKRSAPWKWIIGAFVGVVTLITMALLHWQAVRKGREVAKLKHKQDVAQQKVLRSQLAIKTDALKAETDAYLDTVKDLRIQYGLLGVRAEEVEEEKKKALEKINAIKNWQDVDKYLTDERADTDPWSDS